METQEQRIIKHHVSAIRSQIELHLSHCYSGVQLREIGERFGSKESGVAQGSRRTEIRDGVFPRYW